MAFRQGCAGEFVGKSAQIDFFEPTDKSTVAILQEAIDDVGFDAKKKSLVTVGGLVGQANATLREVVLVAELQPTEQAKILLTIVEPCLNPEFPQEQRKNTMLGKSEYFFMVL